MKQCIILLCLLFSLFLTPNLAFAQVASTPSPTPTQNSQTSSKSEATSTISIIKNFVAGLDGLLGGFIFHTPDVFADTITLQDGTSLDGLARYRNIFYGISIPLVAIVIAFYAIRRLGDDKPYAYKSLLTRLLLIAILFIATPLTLSYSIKLNNAFVDGFQGDGKFTGFINDYLDNADRQIQTGEDPQKFGIPNTQSSFVGGIVGSLWKFILQGVLFFITLLFFLVGFLFIAFQAVIRFASLLFLSVLFPIAIPFALSEKTEGITNAYFKTWFTFLIHQPAFVLAYTITIQIFNTILNQQGASIGMLFLYTGFLFFLGGVTVMVSRIFGDSWTALSANLSGAILSGTVAGAGMSTTREVKRGILGGSVTGARSWMGRSVGRKLGFLTTNKKDGNSEGTDQSNGRGARRYGKVTDRNGSGNGYSHQKVGYKATRDNDNKQESGSIRLGHTKLTEEGYRFTDAKSGASKFYPHSAQPDNTSKIVRDREINSENFMKPKSSQNRFNTETKSISKRSTASEIVRKPVKRRSKQAI